MKVEVKRVPGKESEEFSSTVNTEILFDGKPIPLLQKFSLDFDVNSILPKIKIEFYPTEVVIDNNFKIPEIEGEKVTN